MPSQCYTSSKEKTRFLYFNHLFKEFLEQMIPHLKALIQGVQNLQKNWALHHFEAGYAESNGTLQGFLLASFKMMPRPIFLQILNALYQGFQMRYHLFQKFCGKMVKIKETSFLSTRGAVCFALNCIFNESSKTPIVCTTSLLHATQSRRHSVRHVTYVRIVKRDLSVTSLLQSCNVKL